ncbi:MAG: hypothetical protein NC397_01270 [Clostridium sp.]|nr:hypothetical protein [Clostridium sp.]
MVIYNSFIEQLKNLVGDLQALDTAPSRLKDAGKNDILFSRDTAFELGGSQLPCVSTLAVSSNMKFSDRAYLVGKDLDEIQKDVPFGKIVFLEIEDPNGDDEAFKRIKELDQVKYKFYVKDFMVRASAFSMREQIRVGKNALKAKYSFADLGNKLIAAYKEYPIVKSVEIIFITELDNFAELNRIAQKIKDTTSALNHILDNVLFDCSSCNLKEICDEVDGMKELHMKSSAAHKG